MRIASNCLVHKTPGIRLHRTVLLGAMLTLGLATLTPALGADPASSTPDVDTSKWACRFCTYDYGWTGQLDAGLGKVSADSYKFGEYTGLEKSGGYLLLGGDVKYRSKDGGFLDLKADHLGIGSRSVDADGGTQGEYEWHAGWQEIPQYLFNSGKTPFLGVGSDSLSLPANWVPGGSTSDMTNLGKDSHSVDIQNTRHIASLGVRVTPPASNWQYDVDFQRDTRTGNDMMGGSFLNTTTLLPESMDYRTDQIKASINYHTREWQVGFGYYGSMFHDANSALTWSNPFSPITPGATQGQLSLPPKNTYNAVSLTGAWQVGNSTRLMATASRGKGTQDATFLAPTLNSQLGAAALPQTSLNGEVYTLNYALRAYSNLTDDLNLTFDHTVNKRDNHTSQAAYQQVITDTYLADYATNIPYSYDRNLTDLIADYRLTSQVRLEGGLSHTGEGRTFRESASTQTNSVWASVRATPDPSVTTFLKAGHERRFSGNYTAVDYLFSDQNPLMRQFDLANRNRNQITGQLAFTPGTSWNTGITADYNDDTYDGTSIGLTESEGFDYTLSLGYTPTDKLNVNGYFTQQVTGWRQNGSQAFASPDWQGERDDHVKTIGISAEWADIVTDLNGGVDLSYSFARGITAVTSSGTTPAFPDITMRMQSLSLYAKYKVNARFAFRLDYQIERYVTTDWSLDGVSQDTVSNVLALGIYSPNYVVNVISLTAEYHF